MFEKSVWTKEAASSPDITAGCNTDSGGCNNYDYGGYHGRVRFIETREYLQRVTNARYEVELLEERINFHIDAYEDVSELNDKLEDAKMNMKDVTAEVADQISKLRDVKQQMVMKLRYIDGMSWSQIAEKMDMKERTVQSFHGRALPRMEKSLLDDGLIELKPYVYEAEGDKNGM